MTRRLLLAITAVAALLFAAGILLIPRGSAEQPQLQGTVLRPARAPDFTLKDQTGRLVGPHSFQGRAVVLTFLEAHCTESCPIVAETLRRITDRVSRDGARVPVIAVTTDPESDTPAAITAFLREHHLSHDFYYVTGPRRVLLPVWHAYHLYVPPPSLAALRDSHTSATYVIDGSGKQRVLLGGIPDARALLHDVRLLSGLAVSDRSVSGVLPETGRAAPPIAMRSLDGRTLNLARYRGKVVLLNFWATWCPPCREELPLLSRLAREKRAAGLAVLGVDKLEDRSSVQSFVRRMKLEYPIVLDTTGTIWGTYQPMAVPETYVIGRDGTIRAIHIGPITRAWADRTVVPALRGR